MYLGLFRNKPSWVSGEALFLFFLANPHLIKLDSSNDQVDAEYPVQKILAVSTGSQKANG